MTSVEFGVPAVVAFDFLADPDNGALWQTTMWGMPDLSAKESIGQVSASGVGKDSPLTPLLRTRELDRPRTWNETWVWRRMAADVRLDFVDRSGGGSTVTVGCVFRGGRLTRSLSPWFARAVRNDVRSALKSAARILSERAAEH